MVKVVLDTEEASMTWLVLGWVALAWVLLSVPVSVVVGRGIAAADSTLSAGATLAAEPACVRARAARRRRVLTGSRG